MAKKIIEEACHTFNEYLLIPGYSNENCIPSAVSLKTPLCKFKKGEEPKLSLNLPMVSAIMQSVSGSKLAIALAREGGISFIYGAQSAENEAEMVKEVKRYKAGFVESKANLTPDSTIGDVINLRKELNFSTICVTNDGTKNGKLLGIITDRDYRPGKTDLKDKVKKYMTPFKDLITAQEGITLKECNNLIWKTKINQLPIVDKKQHLISLVFRKDYENHLKYPNELLDEHKRLVVGAGINTKDYETRVPLLIEAGVDVLCIDSSDGFSAWQGNTIKWVKEHYPNMIVGAGNVVDEDGFNYLVKMGADFVKVGIGGGSICITRETKGIGRGQGTAVIEVCKARDKYFEETGIYVPVCSDGGIVFDHHISIALAMGADFVMLGRYFARFDESPTNKYMINGTYYKEYWGEGSFRARNWQRYDNNETKGLSFEEGVDSFVPYAGNLHDNVTMTAYKIKSTMTNCGCISIEDFHKNAVLTLVSQTSIVEGGAHDVLQKNHIKE